MASLGLGHSENNGITRSEDAEAAPEAVAGKVAVAAPEAVDANPVPVESDQIDKALSDEDDVFDSGENDDNTPKTPHFITDYYNSIPLKKITSAETVILSPSTSKDGKKRSSDDRSLSIGFAWHWNADGGDDVFSWKSSSSDDSEVSLVQIENMATVLYVYVPFLERSNTLTKVDIGNHYDRTWGLFKVYRMNENDKLQVQQQLLRKEIKAARANCEKLLRGESGVDVELVDNSLRKGIEIDELCDQHRKNIANSFVKYLAKKSALDELFR